MNEPYSRFHGFAADAYRICILHDPLDPLPRPAYSRDANVLARHRSTATSCDHLPTHDHIQRIATTLIPHTYAKIPLDPLRRTYYPDTEPRKAITYLHGRIRHHVAPLIRDGHPLATYLSDEDSTIIYRTDAPPMPREETP